MALKSKKVWYQRKYFFIFVGPTLLIYTIFWALPIISSILLSFTNWSGISSLFSSDFVGLKNFKQMSIDPIFRTSMKNNLIYGMIMFLTVTPISFFVAYFLDTHVRHKKICETFAYLPAVLPVIVVTLLWKWIYNPQYGMLNSFLKLIGLEKFTTGWLTNSDVALGAITFVSIWKSVPIYLILCLAGLQQVPNKLKEAAIIDGATEPIVLFNVIIPCMQRVLYTVMSLVVIDVFRTFELVYVMTDGGPGYYSTEMLLTYMYKTSFANSMAGYGSAIATTTIFIVLVITSLNLKATMKSNEE